MAIKKYIPVILGLFIIIGVTAVLVIHELNKQVLRSDGERKSQTYNNSSQIPKKIFVTSRFQSIEDLPQSTRETLEEITLKNPGWSIQHFSNQEIEQLLEDEEVFDKKVLQAFHKVVPGAFKADLFRYCILFASGGLYIDINTRVHVTLDSLIDVARDKLCIVEDRRTAGCKFRPGVQIGFLAARKGNDTIKKILDKAVDNILEEKYGKCALEITGPVVAGHVVKRECKKNYTCLMYMRFWSENNVYSSVTGKKVLSRHCNGHHKNVYTSNKYRYKNMYMKRKVFGEKQV